jgi:hypothetical protein
VHMIIVINYDYEEQCDVIGRLLLTVMLSEIISLRHYMCLTFLRQEQSPVETGRSARNLLTMSPKGRLFMTCFVLAQQDKK